MDDYGNYYDAYEDFGDWEGGYDDSYGQENDYDYGNGEDYWNDDEYGDDEDYWYDGEDDEEGMEHDEGEYAHAGGYDDQYMHHDQSYHQGGGGGGGGYGQQYHDNYSHSYGMGHGHDGSDHYYDQQDPYGQNSYGHQAMHQQPQGSYCAFGHVASRSPLTPQSDVSAITHSLSDMYNHSQSLESPHEARPTWSQSIPPAAAIHSSSQSSGHSQQVHSFRSLNSPIAATPQPYPSEPVSRAVGINRARNIAVHMPEIPSNTSPPRRPARPPLNAFHRLFWDGPDQPKPPNPYLLAPGRSSSQRTPKSATSLSDRGSPRRRLRMPRSVNGNSPTISGSPRPKAAFGFLAPLTP
ncbi:hypothetical protein LTR47_000511 [Exophiala xenobiotica]|nr:hypothetical protein LTR47_000511 [Exophiala xenobiotica]KAK5255690.1 hypothetical protein LTS06_000146 [Exophiala xenobiotica]KAK5350199.1 hypothetical protein LTR61_006174 [Exophiala xenobiotica]KAK5387575.1 hypothetical protein LTR11_001240 [Exophiala xenobiotica]KAK5388935.1 hypothetical protein LTS03_001356 [Exophiala xenobiotica]